VRARVIRFGHFLFGNHHYLFPVAFLLLTIATIVLAEPFGVAVPRAVMVRLLLPLFVVYLAYEIALWLKKHGTLRS
jgi:hypothetical protein